MVMMNNNFEKSFRIKHEDNKIFSKFLSKENSKATSSIPSFRVYYNDVPSSVPFIWELQPGTPKHEFSQASLLPPLTPPPSYYSNTNINSHKKPIKKNSRSKLFNALIMKFSPKKSSLPSSPSSSSSSSSSTLSWSSSNTLHSSFSAPTTPSHLNYHEAILPASKLCLVKKALFSIVGGRGSN